MITKHVMTLEDLDCIIPRVEQTEVSIPELKLLFPYLEGYSFKAGDIIVACAFFIRHHDECESVSFIFSDLITDKKYWKEIIRHSVDLLDRDVSRLQCIVNVGFYKAAGFVRHFGFECEGTLKKFLSDGSDVWMFARIK